MYSAFPPRRPNPYLYTQPIKRDHFIHVPLSAKRPAWLPHTFILYILEEIFSVDDLWGICIVKIYIITFNHKRFCNSYMYIWDIHKHSALPPRHIYFPVPFPIQKRSMEMLKMILLSSLWIATKYWAVYAAWLWVELSGFSGVEISWRLGLDENSTKN